MQLHVCIGIGIDDNLTLLESFFLVGKTQDDTFDSSVCVCESGFSNQWWWSWWSWFVQIVFHSLIIIIIIINSVFFLACSRYYRKWWWSFDDEIFFFIQTNQTIGYIEMKMKTILELLLSNDTVFIGFFCLFVPSLIIYR